MIETFEPSAINASGARRASAARLAEWGVSPDRVLLVVSELVTNAVLHARSEFELTLQNSNQVVRVEVSDRNPRLPVWATGAPHDAYSGRGLALVRSLATDWGVESHAGNGKTVWCELAV
ncbi:MAG TPA: ATP-binding protein [Acidimicrobiales bacterium]|nr:ATP-binding protein [Acidimicrobiales bacterium]